MTFDAGSIQDIVPQRMIVINHVWGKDPDQLNPRLRATRMATEPKLLSFSREARLFEVDHIFCDHLNGGAATADTVS